MKKFFYALALLLGSSAAFAAPGDTTWVQAQSALQLDHYGAFDIPVAFPSGSKTYRKIYLTFTLGTYNCPAGSQYCHQWDYDVHNVLMTPGGDTVELGRFITPYANTGVSRFPSTWTHPYVFDVTDYAPLLKGGNTFRIFYSGYSWGFTANVKFAFVEGTPERTVKGVSKLWGGSWQYGNPADPISNHLTTQTRTAPAGTQSVDMKVLVTGHGYDATGGCCEFASHNYTAKVNSNTVATVPVWRADCGFNDIYPQGGTWIYDRANWCPGLEVQQKVHPLAGVTGGSAYTADMVFDPYTNTPNATYPDYGSYNIQANAVAYGGMNKTLDASIEAIYEPNNYDGYFRSNPSDGKPRIKVRNSGASAITAMQIVYGVKDSAMNTYNWTGTIPSLQEDTIELPQLLNLEALSLAAATGNYTFVARVATVNGAADNDPHNDTLTSSFTPAARWPTTVIVTMTTNNQGVNVLNQGPSETSWEIRNSAGNVVASRTNAAINTTYRDTVTFLNSDLYTFHIADGSCDGLHWWVYDQPGSGITAGSLAIKYTNGRPIVLKNTPASGTYNGDFGCGFTEAFSAIGSIPAGVQNRTENEKQISVFPNPANDRITVSLSGFPKVDGVLEIADITGRVIQTQRLREANTSISTSAFAPGLYQVRFTAADGGQWQQRVTVVR